MTLLENHRSLINQEEFIRKFYRDSRPDDHIKFTLYNVVSDYPEKPLFDDILQYKNFFIYLAELNSIPNFLDFITYAPIDPYLSSNITLMKWLSSFYPSLKQQKYIETFNTTTTPALSIALYATIALATGLGSYYIYQKYIKSRPS